MGITTHSESVQPLQSVKLVYQSCSQSRASLEHLRNRWSLRIILLCYSLFMLTLIICFTWVIVDRLTKVAHFLPITTTYTRPQLDALYMKRIVCLHGVPKKIVSDRGTQFMSHFWQTLHTSLGIKLNFSTAYHPQTDGQTERINQILEDMLRACAL